MKKTLRILLAVCLCLSLLPMAALATPEDTHTHCLCAKEQANHVGAGAHSGVTWTAWSQTNSLPDSAGSYYLTGDVTLTASWSPTANVTLCLNGHTVTGANGHAVVTAVPGSTLAVTDCQTTGKLTHADGATGRGVTVQAKVLNTASGGSFALYGGSITGNSTENGGGVYVEEVSNAYESNPTQNAVFSLYGGSITGNTASHDGGGVYARSYFYIKGGSITGNTAGNLGGGVFQREDSSSGTTQTLFVSGMVNITGNTTTDNKASNLCLGHLHEINSAGELNSGSQIGVHTTAAPDGYKTIPGITANQAWISCLTLDDSNAGVLKYLSNANPAHVVLWDNNKRFVGNSDNEYYTFYEAVAAARAGDTLTVLNGYLPDNSEEDDLPVYNEADCRGVALDHSDESRGHVTVDKDLTVNFDGKGADVQFDVQDGKTLTLKGPGGLSRFLDLDSGHIVVESGDHASINIRAGDRAESEMLSVKGGSVEAVELSTGALELTGGKIGAITADNGSLSLAGGEVGMLSIVPTEDSQVVTLAEYKDVTITGMEVDEGQPSIAIQIVGTTQAKATALADALEAKVAANGGMLMSGTAAAQRTLQGVEEEPIYIVTYSGPLTIHTHAWADAWEKNGTHHWHNCSANGCGVTDDSGKSGYAQHTKAWVNTNATQHWETCGTCGWISDKADHTFGDWDVTQEATTSTKGSKARTCTVCGYKETAEIPTVSTGDSSSSRSRRPIARWPFTDVKTTDDCYEAVKYVYEKKWMEGTSATTFAPEGTLTRAMFATVLYRAAGSPEATGVLAFIDTKTDTWYSAAILWATQAGVLRGYGNGCFGPEDPVSVEMLNMVLARQKGEDPQWVGDPALARSATRAEIAQAMMETTRK